MKKIYNSGEGAQHTFRKKLRRAFTITELVIVIAVIAILAAVLIPTFSNVVKNANRSHDEQLVRNMNTSLNAYSIENGGKGPADYEELMKWFAEDGFCDASNPYLLGTDLKQDNVYLVWYPSSNTVFLVNSVGGDEIVVFSPTLGLGNGVSVFTKDDAGNENTASAYALCSKGNRTEEFIAGLYYAFYDDCQGNIGAFLEKYGDGEYSRDNVLNSTGDAGWANAIVAAYDNQTKGYSYSSELSTKLQNATSATLTLDITKPSDTATAEEKTAAQQAVRTALATLSIISGDTAVGGAAEKLEGKEVKFAESSTALEGFTVDFSAIVPAAIGTTHRDVLSANIAASSDQQGTYPRGYSVDFCGLTVENLEVEKSDSFIGTGAMYQDSEDSGYPDGAYNFNYGLFGTIYGGNTEADRVVISNLNIKGVNLDLNDAERTDVGNRVYQTVSDSVGPVCGAVLGNVSFENVHVDGSAEDSTAKGSIAGYDAVGGFVGRCYGPNDSNVGSWVVKIKNCSVSNIEVKGIRKAGGVMGIYGKGCVPQVDGFSLTNVDIIGERNIKGDTSPTDSYSGVFGGHIDNVGCTESAKYLNVEIVNCTTVNCYMSSDSQWVYHLGGIAADLGDGVNALPEGYSLSGARFRKANGSEQKYQVVTIPSTVPYSQYLRLFGNIHTAGLQISGLKIGGVEYTDLTVSSEVRYSWVFYNLGNGNPAADECIPKLLVPKSA